MEHRGIWGALTARPERRFPAYGGVAPVGNGVVHFLSDGTPGDLPVVLLHGASGNLRDFAMTLMPRLSRRHRVIALDRPGFGHSTPVRRGATLAGQTAVLRAALTRLGVGRCILVGHSYGGALALHWTLAHMEEVAGLVLVSAPALDWGGALGGLYRFTSHPVMRHILSHVASAAPERLIAGTLREIFDPEPVPPGYRAALGVELALRPRTFRTNAASMRGLHAEIVAMMPGYGRIARPVEIVHGDMDRVVPAEIHALPLVQAIPGARLTLLEGAGHMPHHTRPADIRPGAEAS